MTVNVQIRVLRFNPFCQIRDKMKIVKIETQIQLINTHVKKDKRGTKAKKKGFSPILKKD